jgi:hypothetical protein
LSKVIATFDASYVYGAVLGMKNLVRGGRSPDNLNFENTLCDSTAIVYMCRSIEYKCG